MHIATKRARQEIEVESKQEQMSFRRKAKHAVIFALPAVFMFSVFMIFAVGILFLYQLNDGVQRKIAVTALALGIKIVGKEGLLSALKDQYM